MGAHVIHDLVGYKGNKPFPIVDFFEHGLSVLYGDQFDYEVVTSKELGEKFGETYPDKHLIRLREDVYNKAVDDDPFSRMTVAHEVGHLLLHEGIPRTLARKASRDIPAYKSSEWQANAFGGALLMPACKIIDLTPEEVSERYQVTIAAARIQCRAMGKEATRWRLPLL